MRIEIGFFTVVELHIAVVKIEKSPGLIDAPSEAFKDITNEFSNRLTKANIFTNIDHSRSNTTTDKNRDPEQLKSYRLLILLESLGRLFGSLLDCRFETEIRLIQNSRIK